MAGRLSYLRERLHTSLWPIPVSWCLLGVLLAVMLLWLDGPPGTTLLGSAVPHLDLDTARRVLGIVAGSIIGVGGVAFSITMVAMTLTSGQYGPRVLRAFLEDRVSKHTLGVFLATYAYALIVLSGYSLVDTPRLTVGAALLLAFAALFGFVQFIHRTATDLQADQIVQRIGRQLRRALAALGDANASQARSSDTLAWRRLARGHQAFPVAAGLHGYVQTVDYGGLKDWCLANRAALVVHVRAGDFLIDGICLCTVYADRQQTVGEAVAALDSYFVTGPMRTPVQDAEYAVIQLNQLAGRALSPGINDPGTAITCIDWFSLALAELVDRDLPGCVFLDDEGRGRVLARVPQFAGLVKAIYAPLRQLSSSDIAVTVKLLESLCSLAELTRRSDRLEVLALHGRLIVEGVARQPVLAFDTRDIEQRYYRLQHLTRPRMAADSDGGSD